MSSFANDDYSHNRKIVYDYSDLEPVGQDDGPSPVVVIDYSPEFRNQMDLFRAILKKGELSDRALSLTEDLLAENASNYTIWQYRRECLRFLDADLNNELDYMDTFSDSNPKNYQIWHHRRVIVQELGDCSREFDFTSEVFDVDAKNYHSWSHRQWVCKTYNNWDHEMPLIEHLLKEDVRNNSAWNHRWFVLHQGNASLASLTESQCLAEVNFSFLAIDMVKRNESAWNYVRGLLKLYTTGSQGKRYSGVLFAIYEKTHALVQSSAQANYLAVALMAELAEQVCYERGGAGATDGLRAAKMEAIGWFTLLVSIDAIRAKAWMKKAAAKRAEIDEL